VHWKIAQASDRKNPDYHNQYNSGYYKENKDKTKYHSEKYYDKMRKDDTEKLKERQRINSRRYIRVNKELVAEHGREWRKNNKGLMNSFTSQRRTKKINATPIWVDRVAIKEVYLECEHINTLNKMCGGDGTFVVDHIVPLQGNTVCGLHVDINLQIITANENAIKSNKYNEEE